MALRWKKAEFVASPPCTVGGRQCRLPGPADRQCPPLRVSVSHRLLTLGSLPPARKNAAINSAPLRSRVDPPQAIDSLLCAAGETGVVESSAQESVPRAGAEAEASAECET